MQTTLKSTRTLLRPTLYCYNWQLCGRRQSWPTDATILAQVSWFWGIQVEKTLSG